MLLAGTSRNFPNPEFFVSSFDQIVRLLIAGNGALSLFQITQQLRDINSNEYDDAELVEAAYKKLVAQKLVEHYRRTATFTESVPKVIFPCRPVVTNFSVSLFIRANAYNPTY